jgi:alpha-tubulin suppressor-like RCC1 family protein
MTYFAPKLTRMKIKALLFGLLVFSQFAQSQNQQPPLISSGYSISSLLCSDGNVYAWGQNTNGLLGTGDISSSMITSPKKVVFPAGVTIKQVSSGLGTHFLAVDCKGNVWAWGDNTYGQIGNGVSSSTPVITPTKVKAGAGPADADGNLTNVLAVTGGEGNSYALLSSGRVMSWGSNGITGSGTGIDQTGTLGNNQTTNSNVPVYVLDGGKPSGTTFLPLENVVQVQASDNASFALTSSGLVYSWGNTNGTSYLLGRALNGGTYVGSTTAPGVSSVARPVTFQDGTPLSDIVSISGGAVFALALDKSGHVWAWGLGDWGGCTGQGSARSNMDPKKVVKGVVTGKGADQQFLLAKSIAAGQGFGMAVTLDGKPVAWGNNSATGSNPTGGILGDGTVNAYSTSPVYILNASTGLPDTNVVSISRGDINGFYTRADNSILTWGNNTFGQLGIASTVDQRKAVPFVYPCTSPDPSPYAFFAKQDTSLCESKFLGSAGFVLHSAFTLSSTPSSYKVLWQKDGKTISTSPLPSSEKWTVTDSGTYTVSIEYVGSNIGCQTYSVARDTFFVHGYAPSFTVPSTTKFCGFPVSVNTTPQNNTLKQFYSWYKDGSTLTPIGTTRGNGAISLASTDILKDGSGNFSVFVEETKSAFGSVGPLNNLSLCGGTGSQTPIGSIQKDVILAVYEDIFIDSIDVYQREFATNATPITWKATLYGTATANGGPVKGTKIQDGALFSTPTTSTTTLRRIPVGIFAKGSKDGILYAFSLSSGGTILDYGNCASTYPFSDNLPNEMAVDWVGSDQLGNPGQAGQYGHYLFNMQFSTVQKYCNRLEVPFKNNCITTGDDNNDIVSAQQMHAAPNPFKDYVNVNTQGASKLTVYTAQGQWVEEWNVANMSSILIGQQWKSGLYVLQLNTASSLISQKVVKE